MNNRSITSVALALLLTGSINSCKEEKKEVSNDNHGEMEHHEGNHHGFQSDHEEMGKEVQEKNHMKSTQTEGVSGVISTYLDLKNALVESDQKKAADAGAAMVENFKNIKVEDSPELDEIIEVAKEHGEHIAKSDLAHQREHFKELSQDISDLLTITGTPMPLYQQYCPMYNKNEGGMWLSSKEEIRNPYFGDKMLKCGKVQKEIR